MSVALVTLDGSAHSRAVLHYLPAILRAGDQVTLLRVAAPPVPRRRARRGPLQPIVAGHTVAMLEPAPPVYAEDENQAIQGRRAELLDYLEDEGLFLRNEGFAVHCEVLFDDEPARAIVGYAREHGPLFIAMATHGRGGVSNAVQGSVTEQVIRSGIAPVLVVRPFRSGR